MVQDFLHQQYVGLGIPSGDPVTTGAEPRGRSGTFICTAPAPNGGGSGDVMVGIEGFGNLGFRGVGFRFYALRVSRFRGSGFRGSGSRGVGV